MTNNYWMDAPTQELVAEVCDVVICMPVRALEALIPRGAEAVELLRGGLRIRTKAGHPELARWCIVGLGNARDPAALPELLPLLPLAARRGPITLAFLAAEAIGRMGAPAVEPLIAAARRAPARARLWHYYAAARIRDEAATRFLLEELEANPRLGDVIVLGLAEQGRRDAVPHFAPVLKRLRRWQRAAVETAVSVLVHGTDHLGSGPTDWRLRYRRLPLLDGLPCFWPCLSAFMHQSGRERSGPPLRTLDEIIAFGPLPSEPEQCDCGSDAPARKRTGLTLCDSCAPEIARMQAEYLLDDGLPVLSEDLFDVLDFLDLPPRDEYGKVDWQAFQRAIIVRAGCCWLIGQGVETRAAGAAMLLAATDAAEQADTAVGCETSPR
jgi:hypothetical protein